MYNLIITFLCVIIPIFIIKKPIKDAFINKTSFKDFVKQNKYEVLVYILFVIGFLVRLSSLANYPAGLNQDEASAGYDAYSVAHYGIDRNGKSVPVHFISWGSGQNVLYSYLMIPFIRIFGLNVLSIRLPMAIIGCISLILIYKLLSKYNRKLAIIGLGFFVICPWHIMKCRWALESNLFPDMVLIAMYIIITALQKNKITMFYVGIAFLSLSVYSYGTAYLFLPIFLGIMLIYLLKKKKIKLYNVITSAFIAFIIALPMIMFVIINTFDYNEICIGAITIPRVHANRYEEITSIFSGDFFKNLLNNFTYNIKILLNQTDGLSYNSMPFFGIIYIFSLPFTVIGIFKCICKNNIEKALLNIGALSSMMLLGVCNGANINRLNIVMVPLIIYTIIGLYEIIENNKQAIIPIFILYSIAFTCFIDTYKKYQGKEKTPFTQGVEEPIKYASSLDADRIYISYSFIEPYIYTLFYTKTPAKEFVETVDYYVANVAFESIKSFGRYYFYIPNDMQDPNAVYVVPNDYEYNQEEFKSTKFEYYTVLERVYN